MAVRCFQGRCLAGLRLRLDVDRIRLGVGKEGVGDAVCTLARPSLHTRSSQKFTVGRTRQTGNTWQRDARVLHSHLTMWGRGGLRVA